MGPCDPYLYYRPLIILNNQFMKKHTHIFIAAILSVITGGFALGFASHAYAYEGMAGPSLITLRTSQDLTVGSEGQVVANLQGLLLELGYLTVPQGTVLGYFGPLTKAALAKFQSSIGVSPTSGYFGPITKTALTAWIARSDNPLYLVNNINNTSSTNTTNNQVSSNTNSNATGYWYQNNWYNSVPTSTTTMSQINGYWSNGTYYPSR